MISATLLSLAFAASVSAHGYATIPSSRTRLGFEVSERCSLTLLLLQNE